MRTWEEFKIVWLAEVGFSFLLKLRAKQEQKRRGIVTTAFLLS